MRCALPTAEPAALNHNDALMYRFAILRGIVGMGVGVQIAAELNWPNL
jgi:cbb3-type cytochrome oxidase subunit 1